MKIGELANLFRRRRPWLGVVVDGEEIRGVRLTPTGRNSRLQATAVVGGLGAALDSALEKLAATLDYDGEMVVSAVPGTAVIERLIRVPVMPAGELAPAVRWEAAQHIPVPLDDMILRHVVLEEEPGRERLWRILVAACRRDTVTDFQRAFQKAGLTLAALDLPTLALWRFFCAGTGPGSIRRLIILNVGGFATNCVFTQGRRLLFSRTSPAGFRALSLPDGYGEAATGAEGGSTEPEPAVRPPARGNAPPGQTPAGRLAEEVRRSLEFFRNTNGEWQPEQVVLCGPAARFREMAALLGDELAMEVVLAPPDGIQPAEEMEPAFDPALVDACGLAMWGSHQ